MDSLSSFEQAMQSATFVLELIKAQACCFAAITDFEFRSLIITRLVIELVELARNQTTRMGHCSTLLMPTMLSVVMALYQTQSQTLLRLQSRMSP